MKKVTTTVANDVNNCIKLAIEARDFDQISRTYWDQNEAVFLEQVLPASLVEQFLRDVDQVRPLVNRGYVPRHKKAGAVSFQSLLKNAPAILALYRSPALLDFLSRLVNAPLLLCPEDDPHSCALYLYTQPGDHIGWHYDNCYYRGARYTVLVGLVEKSEQCRLVAQLYKDDPARSTQECQIPMELGSMVIFNGDRLWHAVSPMEEREGAERIILTLQYVTNQDMSLFKRTFSNLKDAFVYFGPAALLGRKPL